MEIPQIFDLHMFVPRHDRQRVKLLDLFINTD